MKKILTCLTTFLLLSTASFSQNLNLFLSDTEDYSIGSGQPVLSNSKLIFSGSVDGQWAVWALDTTSSEKEVLFVGTTFQNNFGETFQQLDSDYYFIGHNFDDLTFRLMKTDGTAAGTSQVSETNFSLELYQNNGYLFALNSDQQLVVTDGTDEITHDVDIFNITSTCVFAMNNVVVQANTGDKPFKQSNNGTVTTLDIIKVTEIEVFSPQTTRHDGACFVIGNRIEEGFVDVELWKIDASGDLTTLTEVLDSDWILQLMSHQNSLYAVVLAHQSTIIKRFNQDLSLIDATFGDPNSQDLSVDSMRSLGDYIAIKRDTPTISPSQPFVTFANSELAEIPGSTIPFIQLPRAYQTADQLVLRLDGAESRILLNAFDSEQTAITLPESILSYIITSPEETAVYVSSFLTNGLSKLYVVQDNPDIGAITTGSWFNPNIENQGLNIIVGTRANGSQYVNLTGYTYKDGLPLWFAGNTDIEPPQRDIDIALFEFSGIGMFEAGVTPDRTAYGTVRLTMAGCNQLDASIKTPNETFDLLLFRIDDVSFTQNCVD